MKWNSCVYYVVNGNIFGYMWYFDVMVCDWDVLVEGDYELVMLLMYCNFSWGWQGFVQLFLVWEFVIYSVNFFFNKCNVVFWEVILVEYCWVNLQLDVFSQLKGEGWINVE